MLFFIRIRALLSRPPPRNSVHPNDAHPVIQQILHTLGTVAWDQPHYIVEQVKPSVSGKPTSAFITSGNGGEYRKTRHGFAPGYAIVLDSPTEVQLDPMQIDTWNRDKMDISGNKTYPGAVKFVPGQSLIYPPPPLLAAPSP